MRGSFALLIFVSTCGGAFAGECVPEIRPVRTDRWKASLADVEKVLHSAAEELMRHVPGRKLKPISVEPRGGPIVLHRRGPGGEYIVRLDTGETYWAQYAFQFSHELCHILCNYEEKERGNKWFEESICELSSLFVLRRMAETWKKRPPYPNWKSFAPALWKYADNRMAKARLPRGTTLDGWYGKNRAALEKNSCLREKNLIVATALLPLFEKNPLLWKSVQHLNDGASPEPRSFRKYLKDWHDHSPEKCRPLIREIALRFGMLIDR